MTLALVAACAVLGLAVGPALTSAIWRIPRRDVDHPDGAACPSCGAAIDRRDRLAVVSWLALRGRCRGCGERIGAWYPLTEAATAVVLGLTAWRIGFEPELPAYLVLAAAFLALSVTDLQLRLLPNRIIYPTGFVAGPLLVLAALVRGEPLRIAGGAGAGLACFLAFFLLHLVRPDGMAFGDVRLSFLVGMAVGWTAPSLVPVALLFAFLGSSVVGIAYGAVTRRWLKATIPFGPFLAGGALLVVLAADRITSPWSFR